MNWGPQIGIRCVVHPALKMFPILRREWEADYSVCLFDVELHCVDQRKWSTVPILFLVLFQTRIRTTLV